jgi:hypothetical protein
MQKAEYRRKESRRQKKIESRSVKKKKEDPKPSAE